MSSSEFTALDAFPIERVPAAIAHLTARLLIAPASPSGDDLLTPKQVAALLQTPTPYVYRNAKALGAIRVSARKLRFRRSAVERHLKGKAA